MTREKGANTHTTRLSRDPFYHFIRFKQKSQKSEGHTEPLSHDVTVDVRRCG